MSLAILAFVFVFVFGAAVGALAFHFLYAKALAEYAKLKEYARLGTAATAVKDLVPHGSSPVAATANQAVTEPKK